MSSPLFGILAEQAIYLQYYPKVITTRSYDERLATIDNVRKAGISVCSGGIIGLGEKAEDRVGLIYEMSQCVLNLVRITSTTRTMLTYFIRLPEPPESFPVNALVPIKGTPLQDNDFTTIHTMLRTISTARIVLPTSIIRLAAGRTSYTESEQAMCFMAGANAIFTGDRMLTTPTNGWDEDTAMLDKWGLKGMQKSDEHFRQETSEDVFEESTMQPEAKLEQEMMQSNAQSAAIAEKEAQPQVWS